VKRQAAEIMVKEYGISIVRACGLVELSRTAWYRRPQASTERDREVIEALNGIVDRKPRWGFWKCFDRLRLDGRGWNHKRVHRVYCALRLNLPRRTKRRVPTRLRQPLAAPDRLNEIWALDFMADALYGGRPFRTLNVIDEGNREALGIEVATSIPAQRVIRVMEQLIDIYGKPNSIRVDNGSELTSSAFTEWCEEQHIELRFIQPGKPDQNAYIERFNRTYRNEVLDAYVFDSIEQVREITESWLPEYNEERPHDSLGRVPPLMFMPRRKQPAESSYQLCP
jgi:putative transposase